MTWPNVAVNTTNVDQTTDSPATARADILDAIQKLNVIIVNAPLVPNANGQAALGGALSSWSATLKGLEAGSGALVSDGTSLQLPCNAYSDASAVWRYKAAGAAAIVNVGAVGFTFYVAPSGAAGAAITWTQVAQIDGTGNFSANGVFGSIGYGVGAGGFVVQAGSKSSPVTLNRPSGVVQTNAAALSAGTTVSFLLTCICSANDVCMVSLQNGSPASYNVWASNDSSGSNQQRIFIKNISGGSLSEALNLNFAFLKVATS